MDRNPRRVALLVIAIAAGAAWAEPVQEPPKAVTPRKEKPKALERAQRKEAAEFPEVSKFLDTLPPDYRDSVKQKFHEWVQARAEQQKLLKLGSESEETKKFLDRLPPEQREKFRQNLKRWQNLPPEEREALRMREELRVRQVNKEIDQVLDQAGLTLTKDRRQIFSLRYTQERRKIEEQIHNEMEAKRAPMVKEMTERLVAEFKSESSAPARQ